mgnify:CR=1 FL=1
MSDTGCDMTEEELLALLKGIDATKIQQQTKEELDAKLARRGGAGRHAGAASRILPPVRLMLPAEVIHGHAVCAWQDGRMYDGSWKENTIEGEGRFHWPDGRVYEGQSPRRAERIGWMEEFIS